MADKKRGENMSPRTGRPPIENPKSDRITVRLTEYEQEILSECVERFGASSAEILRRGLALMEVEKDNEEARQLLDAIVLLHEFILCGKTALTQKQIEQVKFNFKEYLDSIKK